MASQSMTNNESAVAGIRAAHLATLLDFPLDANPYMKWWGTHWRLVELADLATPPDTPGLDLGIERELSWLESPPHRNAIRPINGLVRVHASQEGNAVYACARLGRPAAVRGLMADLLEWQWPDGGWNCDVHASGVRSSFHESVTPALGLAAYAEATGDHEAQAGARRMAELLLDHELFRSRRTGQPIHPRWTKLHYPAYWHYDVLQGLRLLHTLDLLDDPRAGAALEILRQTRKDEGSRDHRGRQAGRATPSSGGAVRQTRCGT
jgi:hypothetical protein